MADPSAAGGEFYRQYFDPRVYLENYFNFKKNAAEDEYLSLALPHFCKAFAPGGLKGDTLIDIGTGPTIYQLLSACESFKEITATDYSERSQQEVQKWLKKEPDAFDWTSVTKFVCELEGNRVTVTEKEEKLRKAVKKILKCDVLKTNPLEPLTLSQFDCVLCAVCLEAACKSKDEVCAALQNISTLSKPGGYLVLCGDVGTTYFQIGEVMFSFMTFDEDLLREAVTGASYVIEKMELSSRDGQEASKENTNFTGVYFIVARKL